MVYKHGLVSATFLQLRLIYTHKHDKQAKLYGLV